MDSDFASAEVYPGDYIVLVSCRPMEGYGRDAYSYDGRSTPDDVYNLTVTSQLAESDVGLLRRFRGVPLRVVAVCQSYYVCGIRDLPSVVFVPRLSLNIERVCETYAEACYNAIKDEKERIGKKEQGDSSGADISVFRKFLTR